MVKTFILTYFSTTLNYDALLSKKTLIAEYTVRTSHSPIGISEYRLAEPLPAELGGSLPSIENIEKELKP
jgi:hypothetical protein